MDEEYQSSIPQAAEEKIVDSYESGQKHRAEYVQDGEIVGVRYFHESGEPLFEYGLKNGASHGMEYRWDLPGRLLSAAPYEDGLPHGTARQWSQEGELIGTYTMERGTGIDLWWQDCGSVYLSEVLYKKDGRPHGFEWWINANQKTVYVERHWWEGSLHGIEREWNARRRQRRGYPRYYVRGERVDKRRYIRACAKDPTLPPFREEDNRPEREFPQEIQRRLRGESGQWTVDSDQQ